jgi:hypothetical protein
MRGTCARGSPSPIYARDAPSSNITSSTPSYPLSSACQRALDGLRAAGFPVPGRIEALSSRQCSRKPAPARPPSTHVRPPNRQKHRRQLLPGTPDPDNSQLTTLGSHGVDGSSSRLGLIVPDALDQHVGALTGSASYASGASRRIHVRCTCIHTLPSLRERPWKLQMEEAVKAPSSLVEYRPSSTVPSKRFRHFAATRSASYRPPITLLHYIRHSTPTRG